MELKPKFIIKITSKSLENFRKTVLEGIEKEGEKKYFWNIYSYCGNFNSNDVVLFIAEKHPAVLGQIIKTANGDEFYNERLKKEWKDKKGRFKAYFEFKKNKRNKSS
ncbi:hypothetical protein [Aquifex aeolicus]|uniref:hypothetical protein n=1 Tax=Aquifex aeolicus TaxID=63363 RepID=UPI0013E8DDC0|nr:hypothetical protein [Aquifex aeolicus]